MDFHYSLLSDTKEILSITTEWPAPWHYSIPLSQSTCPLEIPFLLATIIQMLPVLQVQEAYPSAILGHHELILLWLPTAFTASGDYSKLFINL
jgi:hypothetical protein